MVGSGGGEAGGGRRVISGADASAKKKNGRTQAACGVGMADCDVRRVGVWGE